MTESITLISRVLVSNCDSERGRSEARPGPVWRAPLWSTPHAACSRRGYGATTIEAISEVADVPSATVYRLFASKHGILKSLLDVSIVGDDDNVPMADRPHVRSLLTEREPREQLAGFVESPRESTPGSRRSTGSW